MPYEVDFLPVGTSNGDAVVIRYGDTDNGYFLHVVDGGYTDTAETIIKHINKYYPGYFINHMVLSHADNDHAMGLIGVLEHFDVKHLWMNRPWLYAADILHHFHQNYTLEGLIKKIRELHPYLVQLEEIADSKGTKIHDAFKGDLIGDFRVLAPSRERYIDLLPDLAKTPTSYREQTATTQQGGLLRKLVEAAKNWLDENWNIETLSDNPEPTSASNETCLVQHAVLDGNGILLTADVGPAGLAEAADYAESLGILKPPRFVQVPHHGSRRNVTPTVLNRWLGPIMAPGAVYGTAFCSIGSDKPEYPRGQVQNAFERRGYPVHATRTVLKSHYSGEGHADLVASVPEPFKSKVEV